jgi:anion-transporting  ArsA/GET3 family ATPase
MTAEASQKIKLPRVIFVTGKGGTGKSTVAAALALALARHGPVTLIDLDRRRSAIKAVSAIPDAARRVDHPVEMVALTAQGELEAFIERIVPLKMIARRMLQSPTFGFVTTALPGLEAFLILERIRIANEAAADRVIVVDAPATGGALELLKVPAGVQRLAPIGTLHRLAAEVEKFIQAAARFGVLLTTRAEELALREAIDASAALSALGVGCIAAVLNECETALFAEEDLAKLTGLDGHLRLAQARRHAADSAVQARRQLHHAGLHLLTLPMLYCPALTAAEFEVLANNLDEGLFAR